MHRGREGDLKWGCGIGDVRGVKMMEWRRGLYSRGEAGILISGKGTSTCLCLRSPSCLGWPVKEIVAQHNGGLVEDDE